MVLGLSSFNTTRNDFSKPMIKYIFRTKKIKRRVTPFSPFRTKKGVWYNVFLRRKGVAGAATGSRSAQQECLAA